MKNGQLVRRNHQNKWVLTRDLSKPASPESAARRARKERAKAGKARKVGDQSRGTGVVPIEATTLEDKLRVKLELRARQRKVTKDGTAAAVLVAMPGVHTLSFATRYIDGGRDRFLEVVKYAALDNHPAAVAWWMVYADLLQSEREIVSFDDVCAAAGIRPSDFVALIVKTAMEQGRDAGNLVAAFMHPLVVKAAAESAQRIDGAGAEIGFKDRERLLQGAGLFPIPRAMSINVHASANAQAASAAKGEPSVPSFTETLRHAEGIKSGVQKELTAAPLPSFVSATQGAAAPAAIDAQLISPDVDESTEST